jgi:hypothetical protein
LAVNLKSAKLLGLTHAAITSRPCPEEVIE